MLVRFYFCARRPRLRRVRGVSLIALRMAPSVIWGSVVGLAGHDLPVDRLYQLVRHSYSAGRHSYPRGWADDYVTKPFYLRELLARVRTQLRRTSVSIPEILRFPDLVIDRGRRTVVQGEREVRLT